MKRKDKKVMVALSGGVDSSVSAAILKKEGYEIIGGHIKISSADQECSEQDAADARLVAKNLDIPFYVFDLTKEYRERIIEYFVNSYAKGETPNPDVLCNREIKFGIFLEKALSLGADFVATGHYAQLEKHKDYFKLLRGKDGNKDQSYFLWQLSQDQLSRAVFPIGGFEKDKVRKLAEKFDLPVAKKKDSQGICFLGHVKVKEFLKNYLSIESGDILSPDERVVGKHDGSVFYTIGQRHGFNLSSSEAGFENNDPLFIVDKDIGNNTLTVAPGRDNPLLYKNKIWLRDLNFINSSLSKDESLEVEVQIRYRQKPVEAILIFDKNRWRLDFKNPVWAPALGQHAVFYLKDEVLGGGVISEIG